MKVVNGVNLEFSSQGKQLLYAYEMTDINIVVIIS